MLLALGQQQHLPYPTNGPRGDLATLGLNGSCLMLVLSGDSPPAELGFCWGEVQPVGWQSYSVLGWSCPVLDLGALSSCPVRCCCLHICV